MFWTVSDSRYRVPLIGLLVFVPFAFANVGSAGPISSVQDDTARKILQLEQRLKVTNGSKRIPLLFEMTELAKDDCPTVVKISTELLLLLQDHPDSDLEGQTRLRRSWALQGVGRYADAQAEAGKAIELLEKGSNASLLGRGYYMMAVAKYRMAIHPEAFAFAEKARKAQESCDNQEELATVFTLIGAIHRAESSFDQSIDYHLKALRISEKRNDPLAIARSQNNIGLIYWKLDRYKDAYRWLQKANGIFRQLKAKRRLGTCANNLGLVLVELKRPKDALPYLHEALKIYVSSKNIHGQAKALNNLGFAHGKLGDSTKSLKYIRQSYALRKKIGDKVGMIRSQGNIAALLQDQNKHKEAIKLLKVSLKMARKINARSEQAMLLLNLSESYKATKNYLEALKYHEEFHELKSSLAGLEVKQRIAKLESRAALERKEREIDDLNRDVEQRAAQLAREKSSNTRLLWTNILLGFCCAVVVVLFLLRLKALRLMRISNEKLTRTTHRLAESEQRYRTLFESEDIAKLVIDSEASAIIDLNLPARQLLNATLDSGTLTVDSVEPHWVRSALSRLLLPNEKEVSSMDDCWVEPSGQVRWTEVQASSVSIEGQNAILVAIRDTTERRAQEQARLRTDQLESLGMLAGGIAHDFNNALTAILGYVTLARTFADEQVAERLAMAEVAVEQASNLTQQLLAFSKGGEPVLRFHDVEELLRGAVELASAGSKMHVEVDVEPGLWNAELDRSQFTQVVSNLVINASQATDGRGLLEVSASNFRGVIEASGDPDQAYVRIDFTDNGEGISPTIHSQIFDPYFSTKANGNGLGLTTAFAIVKRHGGDITFTSAIGRGTRFSVFFPATFDTHRSAIPFEESEFGGGRLLVLDDEPLVRKVYRDILENWGFEVETVSDGESAVQLYRQRWESGEPFDALIMDLTIPGGLGGHEAMTQILRINADARAIVSSGYSDNPIMARYREAGFVASLAKPFRKKELATVLQQATFRDPRTTVRSPKS